MGFRTIISLMVIGFRLGAAQPVCGGNFTSPQGSFDYLFYGTEQGYPDDQECHWTITAEPCKVVKLNFTTFLLEEQCYDGIEVFDGQSDSASLIGAYCNSDGLGSTGPDYRPYTQPVYSSNSLTSLHLVFESDFSNVAGNNYTGFSVSWETIDPDPICDPVTAPANGKVFPNTSEPEGCIATASCKIGYTLNGISSTTCGVDGNWSHTLGECIPDCPLLTPPKYGNISYNASVSSSVPQGVVATIECDDEIEIKEGAEKELECGAGGKWSADVGKCKKVCPKIKKDVVEREIKDGKTIKTVITERKCEGKEKTLITKKEFEDGVLVKKWKFNEKKNTWRLV